MFLQVHSSRSFLLFPSWGWALPTGQWQGGVVWIPPEYTTITVEDDAQHWWWDRAFHTVGPTQAYTTTTVSCCMRSAGWVLISILDLAEQRLAFHLPWIYYINIIPFASHLHVHVQVARDPHELHASHSWVCLHTSQFVSTHLFPKSNFLSDRMLIHWPCTLLLFVFPTMQCQPRHSTSSSQCWTSCVRY